MWLAGGSLWLAGGLVILPGVCRWRKLGWHQWLAALATGVFLFSLAANYGVLSRTQLGLVVKKNAPLQLTPTHDGEIVSTLAAGETARVVRRRGNYVFIRTLGAAGWMDQSDFRMICPR